MNPKTRNTVSDKRIAPSTFIFAADVLQKKLDAVTDEIEGVRRGDDPEHIHDIRVASRRLHTALRIFADQLPKKSALNCDAMLRKIRKSSGSARDLDVQILFVTGFLLSLSIHRERIGVQRLLLRLRQRRERLQEKVLRALDQFEKNGIAESVLTSLRNNVEQSAQKQKLQKAGTLSLSQRAFLEISARLEELLAFEQYAAQPEKMKELHAMRIAAKHLRYSMEIFSPLFGRQFKYILHAVRDIQEYLGQVHDCDVWIEFLPAFIEKERERMIRYSGHARHFHQLHHGIEKLRENRIRGRAKSYKMFFSLWTKIIDQHMWTSLTRQLQLRLPRATSVQPARRIPLSRPRRRT